MSLLATMSSFCSDSGSHRCPCSRWPAGPIFARFLTSRVIATVLRLPPPNILPSLAAGEFARCALVSTQVVDVDGRELVDEGLSGAVGRVTVDKAAVADKADDAAGP